jgi:hypothetical protein
MTRGKIVGELFLILISLFLFYFFLEFGKDKIDNVNTKVEYRVVESKEVQELIDELKLNQIVAIDRLIVGEIKRLEQRVEWLEEKNIKKKGGEQNDGGKTAR